MLIGPEYISRDLKIPIGPAIFISDFKLMYVSDVYPE